MTIFYLYFAVLKDFHSYSGRNLTSWQLGPKPVQEEYLYEIPVGIYTEYFGCAPYFHGNGKNN